MPLASIPQDDNNGWTWLLWPAIITGILIWELATVRLLGQPLLFHGLSMGLFGAGYLLMVLDSRVPFYIQFSTWLGCATRTGMWTYHDTRDLSADSRRIAGLALVILPLLLDLSIISAFASGGDSTTKHIQSAPLLFVAFLLPCVSLSAFVCSCFRAIYKQIIQRNAQVAEQLHVV
ncbi:hypothetical protein F5Y10DRAFT_247837 [Nemania abortiva]|nr:hypothetical protein F5Y10DRAFT_247837 [Nemania abortiva]